MARVVAYVRTDCPLLDRETQRVLIDQRVAQALIGTAEGPITEVQTWSYTSDLATALRGLTQYDVVLIHSLEVITDLDSSGGLNVVIPLLDSGATLVDCRDKTGYTKDLSSFSMLAMMCLVKAKLQGTT